MTFEEVLAFISQKKALPEDIDEYINTLKPIDAWAIVVAELAVEIVIPEDLQNLRLQLEACYEYAEGELDKEDEFDLAVLETIKEDAVSLSFDENIIRESLRLGYYPMSIPADGCNFLTIRYHFTKCIITFDCLHIPRNTARYIRSRFSDYTLTFNKAFGSCVDALLEAYPDNWICPELRAVFEAIHNSPDKNVSMDSVEIWHGGKLVAGEIGFVTGNTYASLSGFHRENDIGMVQMSVLGLYLKQNGFSYWDLGMSIPYKYRYGAKDCTRDEQEALYSAIKPERVSFTDREIPLSDFLPIIESCRGE